MTDEQKDKTALAEKDKRIADLEGQLANVGRGPNAGADYEGDVRARAVAEAEARDEVVPFPSQADLDRVKLGEHVDGKSGGYKTRQSKPA